MQQEELLSPEHRGYINNLLMQPTDRNMAIIFKVLAYAFEKRAENNKEGE